MPGDETSRAVQALLDAPLTDQQQHLLQAILRPVIHENRADDAMWAQWNSLHRGFARDGFGDAQSAFNALPVLDGPRGRYGLVWRTMPGVGRQLRSDERVGLTLAGLHLADPFNDHERANRLAQLVALLGDREARDPLDSDQVPTRTIELGDMAEQYLKLSEWGSTTTSMSLRAAVHLLGHEPVPITVEWDRHTAVIGQGHLEPYREVSTAREYLAELVRQTGLHELATGPSSAGSNQTATVGAHDSTAAAAAAFDMTSEDSGMDGWPAWAQDAREVADARVLARLLEGLGEDGQTEAATAPLVEELGLTGVDPDHLAVRLVQLGYFRPDSLTVTPGWDALLITEQGRKAAREFAAARQRIRIAPAARSALLRWLYEVGNDRRPNPSDILDTPQSWFYGTQFTLEQIANAARSLRDRHLIDAIGTAQNDVLRLKLTTLGERCVEHYGADSDALESPDRPQRNEHIMVSAPTTSESTSGGEASTVFLVHGHDDALKNEVARFIERTLNPNVSVVILHEQPNAGRTVIEKFEGHARKASYAVVLLTPDDHGGPVAGALQDRARQNVVLELGYFLGSLGRNRVAAINKGVEIPSDLMGVLYITYPGQWKEDLRNEFREAGLPLRP